MIRSETKPDRESDISREVAGAPELERRHLTVMFSDLVESTTLSQELDPEELAELLHGMHRICHEVMDQFSGHVARYIGDAVLTYFGWPKAAENDAERSVRAGLALVDAISGQRLFATRPLAIRVAVASGLVVVRNTVGGTEVIGETPNLAARLQNLAEPNGVVIAPSTWRLVGDVFEYRDLGEHRLKGIANPVRVRQVLRARRVGDRFASQHEDWQAPFVGRAGEMELLMERWEGVRQGAGQAVLISGEAGVGKSRLVHEFCERARTGSATVKRLQCSSLHSTTPLHPIIQHIRFAANCWETANADQQVKMLREFLCNAGMEVEPALGLLCHLLHIKSAEVPPLPDVVPQLIREMLVQTLSAQLRRESERAPVLLSIEDVQWIDPTTEEFVSRVLGELAPLRICLVATSRGSFPTRWRLHGHATSAVLDTLDQNDSALLVRAIAGERLDGPTVEGLVARADGLPLFLEELTRAIDDEGTGGHPRAWSERRIPATLQAFLTARFDRLGNAKHLAQVGSIFGRRFSVQDLRTLSEWSNDQVDSILKDLLASGLARRRGAARDDQFAFKHSLVQDAAYDSLLNTEKKRLHRNALAYLESLPQGAVPDLPETLAFHAERGEAWDKAVQCLTVACGRAVAKSANREAVAFFDRALAALHHLPADQISPYAIDIRLIARPALLALGNIERLMMVMREAGDLARRTGDKRRQAATFGSLSNVLWLAGRHRDGLEYADVAERLASELDDFDIGLTARFNRAHLRHALGMVREAAQIYASIIERLQDDLQYKRFGHPGLTSVIAAGFLAWCAVDLGEFPLARRTIDRAFGIVDKVPEPYSLVYAHLANGLYHLARGEASEAVAAFETAKAVKERSQMDLPVTVSWLAAAYLQAGRAQEAVDLLREADRTASYKHGGKYNWFYHHLGMAQANLALGDISAAKAAVRRAEEIAVDAEQIVHVAWACKVQGDITSFDEGDGQGIAGRAYAQALGIAAPRGLRPLEALCHAGLARLHERAGRSSEAAHHDAEARKIREALGLAC